MVFSDDNGQDPPGTPVNSILTAGRPCSRASGWPMRLASEARMKPHVSYAKGTTLALGLCFLATGTGAGWADETFLCQDGSSVTVDGDNRADMHDHPCVKAWFAANLALQKAQAEQGAGNSSAGVQPVLHRFTVHRAVALRDLRSRPAYLAWSRARTVQKSPAGRISGSLVAGAPVRTAPSPPIGVTIRVPSGTR
jgi:hypothetical protein